MWGDRGVGGPFDDLYVLVVVVIGMGVFLASVSVAYLRYEQFNADLRFQRDAFAALDRIMAFEPALRDGAIGLFDVGHLEAFNVTSMRSVVGAYGFRVLLADGQGAPLLDVATGPTGGRYRVAVGSVALWMSATNVSTARLSLTIWRS